MTEVLVADPQNGDESQWPADAWTASAVGPFAWRLRSGPETRWRAYAMHFEHFLADYLALTGAVTGTAVDYSGTKFVLAELAGWTCPAAIPTAARVQVEGESDALKRLRSLRGGFGVSAHDVLVAPSSTQEMVRWLYEESGLTWDQLARTLGVSRRSVHAWANGQRVSGRNLERLSHVYSTIRAIEATSRESRRHALFTPQDDGQPNLFDQLVIQARKAPLLRDEHAVRRRLGIAPAD